MEAPLEALPTDTKLLRAVAIAYAGLETLLAVPATVTIPWLHLDPRWAPLWDHPRFGELEAEYAKPS